MQRVPRMLLFLAILVGGPRSAEAGTVTYDFSGTLNDPADSGAMPLPGIPFGTPFTATFTYDYPQTGTPAGIALKYTYDDLTVKIGPDTLHSSGGTIYVYDKADGYPTDLLYTTPGGPISGTLAGYTVDTLSIDLQNVSGGVFLHDALPGAGLTLADFTGGGATFVEFDYQVPGHPGESILRADPTDLSASSAPEPATLSFCSLGLV
jgi:hypothetical protein